MKCGEGDTGRTDVACNVSLHRRFARARFVGAIIIRQTLYPTRSSTRGSAANPV